MFLRKKKSKVCEERECNLPAFNSMWCLLSCLSLLPVQDTIMEDPRSKLVLLENSISLRHYRDGGDLRMTFISCESGTTKLQYTPNYLGNKCALIFLSLFVLAKEI